MNGLWTAARFFLVISGELFAIFLAVTFFVELLMTFLTPSRVREFLRGRIPVLQYALGALLGAVTPFCSCSTVPILTGLLRAGVPFGPVMAFLFSSPVLNPVILGLFLMLLGPKTTIAYAAITFLCSMALAACLSRLGYEKHIKPQASADHPGSRVTSSATRVAAYASFVRKSEESGGFPESGDSESRNRDCCGQEEGNPVGQPIGKLIGGAFGRAFSAFRGVFWYLILGAGIGAFIYGFIPQDLVVRFAGRGSVWSIPAAALLGVPMYVRAETVIPIGAALVGKGMGTGTVIALVIAGAGASIPEVIILGSIFKRRLLVAFVTSVFLVAVVAGFVVDGLPASTGLR